MEKSFGEVNSHLFTISLFFYKLILVILILEIFHAIYLATLKYYSLH
jgi:hypothetical protein